MPARIRIPGQLSTRCVDCVAMMIAIDRTGKKRAPGYQRLPALILTRRTRSASAAARR